MNEADRLIRCTERLPRLENSEKPEHEDQTDGNTQQPKDNRHSTSPAFSQSNNAHYGGVFPALTDVVVSNSEATIRN
jgi:hypothetical protein